MTGSDKTPGTDEMFAQLSPILDVRTAPLLLTEVEVITLLRIPEVSKATDYRNVIKNLKRIHDLPCIHICKQPLYPLEAIRQWIMQKAEKEQHIF